MGNDKTNNIMIAHLMPSVVTSTTLISFNKIIFLLLGSKQFILGFKVFNSKYFKER